MRNRMVVMLAAAVLAAACSSDPAVSSGDDAAIAIGEPAVNPGFLTEGELQIGDVTVEYVTVVPAGFTTGDSAPVALVFPPGGQDFNLTRAIVERTHATEALSRGWVVVSPAAPNGELFFQGSEALIPDLVNWIRSWVDPEGGKLHLVGVSNGGISSFRAAANQPDEFASILVYPGFPRGDADKASLGDLVDVPVRMFVGETDTGWIAPMQDARNVLNELGGDAILEIVAGQGHRIDPLGDGVRIYDELDAVR